ncbi:MAG: nuclear transport factor 2 family protein [Candidatus Thiodiazotropha sp. (ex Codakia rugifera)]|nr:nuclear transport factor 2 family protein [Candidatus Thiodiazotropha sp. (ex Codakia rugifera)]
MTPLELANRYMEIFYGGESLDALASLFSDKFSFKGPFYEFNTAEEYIESLIANPPKELGYKIIEAYENNTSACLVYQFSKPGISTIMSQIFEVSNGKISRILLVFDTRAFT